MSTDDQRQTEQVSRQTPFEELPLLMTVSEFQRAAKLGRRKAFELGKMLGIRFGRTIRIPKSALQKP
jgi:hypothetical protein